MLAPRRIPPTLGRSFADEGHRQPNRPFDVTGRHWRGFSRIKNRPERRKANARRLRKHMVASRKGGMARLASKMRRPSLHELNVEQQHLADIAEALKKATKR